MSQSSQESINLLSPPSPSVDANKVNRGGASGETKESTLKRTKARVMHSHRRSSDHSAESADEERRSSKDDGAKLATENEAGPKWRAFSKSYKKHKSNPSPTDPSPNSSPNNNNEAPKRPSEEFLRTNLPYATKKSLNHIKSIAADIEAGTMLGSTIEVAKHDVLSQITMMGTQAYCGRRDEDSDESEVDDEGGLNGDVFEYKSLKQQEDLKKAGDSSVGSKPFDGVNRETAAELKSDDELNNEDDESENLLDTEPSIPTKLDGKFNAKPKAPAAAKKKKMGRTELALLVQEECSSLEKESTDDPDYEPEPDNIEHENMEQDKEINNELQKPPQQTRQQTILTTYTTLQNMSAALRCPICQHSLNSSTFLPCGHAFCSSCLTDALKINLQCPYCRRKCTRRSGSRVRQLDEIVEGFKRVGRAFGFAPVVYSERVGMTQLRDGEDGESEGDEVGRGRKRRLDVDEALEHHRVAQSNHQAFTSLHKSAPAPSGRMTKDKLERINATRRYQLMAEDQAAVMRADQEALEKVMRKKRIVEATLEFAGNYVGKGDGVVPRETVQCGVETGGKSSESEGLAGKTDGKDQADASASKEDTQHELENVNNNGKNEELIPKADSKMPPTEPKESQDTFYTALKSSNGTVGKKDSAIPPSLPHIQSQESFHTAKSGLSKNQRLSVTASPIVLHDGNTVKKRREDEKRQSLGTVASSIVLHDGNTAKKSDDRTPRRSGRYLPFAECDVDSPKVADVDKDESGKEVPKVATAGDKTDEPGKEVPNVATVHDNYENDDVVFEGGNVASQQSSIVSEDSVEHNLKNDDEEPPAVEKEIVVGSVVMVQARTWPGINKHGGVGRVLKVGSSRHSKKFDVSYVLGGKEKGVDEIYVSLHEPEQSENKDSTVGARVSRSAEKAQRPTRKRIPKAAKKPGSSASIPVYNDEALQHIPADVLEWAGIVQSKGKEKGGAKAAAKSAPTSKQASKKRVLKESSANVEGPATSKKQKNNNNQKKVKAKAKPEVTAPSDDSNVEAPTRAKKPKHNTEKKKTKKSNDSLISFQKAIENVAIDELTRCADERYASLLSTSNDEPMTLHAVTSSLSDDENKRLTSMIKMLKSKNVTLKIMKDFKPDKTQLCITSASASTSSDHDIVSKSRTLKIMRSALLGLPILTPQWIESCIEREETVAPTGSMCVRTLPLKTTNDEHQLTPFGVTKYAAAIGKTDSKLLANCSVFLCGEWKSTGRGTMKDLKMLLEDAGATIVNSASMATKTLAELAQDNSTKHFVFLCDDSHLDVHSGLSQSLFSAGKSAIEQVQSRVITVHFHWLFDCVSCAKLMPGADYEPLAPRCKELWSLSCDKNCNE